MPMLGAILLITGIALGFFAIVYTTGATEKPDLSFVISFLCLPASMIAASILILVECLWLDEPYEENEEDKQ